MKERPIIFSGPMVRAILDGRKTQMRRITKEFIDNELVDVGDCLWVRESGYRPPKVTGFMLREGADTWPKYIYSADGDKREWCRDHRWKSTPSIHMPRWASRITLEITDVRVERLNSISEVDAKDEGVESHDDDGVAYYGPLNTGHACPIHEYKRIWNSINGPDSWDSNPWVWVVKFKTI